MIINQYNNIWTNQVSNTVADELIARMDALSALNRNVSDVGSSKQYFAVRDRLTAKPELLRKFQEWRDRKIAYAEVRAFRNKSECCRGRFFKTKEAAPFIITGQYESDGMVPPVESTVVSGAGGPRKSYGDIKYSIADGLNKPSFYNGQPQAFLQSVKVMNEGYGGVVQRVAIKMRVFTREAFEIIDRWYLRPGNEMLLKFGWSVPLTSTEASSEVIHAVIFNFSAVLTDDIGWDITIYGIAKGNLAVGMALGGITEEISVINQQQNTENENAIFITPNLTTIISDELNRLRRTYTVLQEGDSTINYTAGDLDSSGRVCGIIYESAVFPHGLGRIKMSIDNSNENYTGRQSLNPDGTPAIPNPQDIVRYYICMGDLVHFFNERVFKQAPELYEAVQLLVENQPTTYDPEIVSCIPHIIMFSNAKQNTGGMSSYGENGSVEYGFKYKKYPNGDIEDAIGCDGFDFYPESEFTSIEDVKKHREDRGIFLQENGGEKIAAFNIAHIWISVDAINDIYTSMLRDKALDPQFKTVFDFFDEIFKLISQASGEIINLTLAPDLNSLYEVDEDPNTAILSTSNPLLKKTQVIRITDINFQIPENFSNAPRSFDFKLNDVNATLLQDVRASLQLPSKLQAVAYTYGRAGINDSVVDIADDPVICSRDFQELIQKRQGIIERLRYWRFLLGQNLSQENIDNLQNALNLYRQNPQPNTSGPLDTTYSAVSHQAWIYSKLYPIELQFKLDGIAGFRYGNKINILNALPSRYSNYVYFTITKIEHEVQDNRWVTTINTIARLKNSNGALQFPQVINDQVDPDLCDDIPIASISLLPTTSTRSAPIISTIPPTPETTLVPESAATVNAIPQPGTIGVNSTGVGAFPLPGVPGGGGGFGLPEPDRPVLP